MISFSFFFLLLSLLSGKETFAWFFLKASLSNVKTFMTGIKLEKLDFIGNWGFGLMLRHRWCDMAAVCLVILSSNVAASRILCSVGCICHKGRNGILNTRKVEVTFPWQFVSVSFAVMNIY